MFKRTSVFVFVILAALATLSLLAAVSTAQQDSFGISRAKGPQRSLMNSTLAMIAAPKPGEPVKGVGVIIQRRPGGSASLRTTDSSGKIDLSDLAPGSYWMEIVPMTAAQKAANADGETYSHAAVTITGTQLVGGPKTRSADVTNWKFVEPPIATARRTPLPNTFAARIIFEVGPNTGGGPPLPMKATIVKSNSNIYN
jgi:hypothetical protein